MSGDECLKEKIKIHLLWTSIILIFAVLALTGWMNINTFEQKYSESKFSSIILKGQKVTDKIEYSIRYGKQIESYFGMNELLIDWVEQQEIVENARIILPDQKIKYAYYKDESQLDQRLTEANNFSGREPGSFAKAELNDQYHIFIPIKDKNNLWIGSFEIILPSAYISKNIEPYFQKLINYLKITIIFVLIILIIYVLLLRPFNKKNELKKSSIIMFLVILMGISQITYGVCNYLTLKNAFTSISKDTATEISKVVQEDIEAIVRQGVSYDQLYGLDDYMEDTLNIASIIDSFWIEETGFYRMNAENQINDLNSVDSKYLVKVSMCEDNKQQTRSFTTVISKDFFNDSLREIILEIITIFAISFFLMIEVVLFLMVYLNKKMQVKQNEVKVNEEEEEIEDDGAVVRMLAFLTAASCFLSVSFIPKVMNQLYRPISGISNEFILGLPVSIVFFAGIFFTVIGGKWVDRQGWKKVLLAGLSCVLFSSVSAGMVQNAVLFVLTRGIYGIGYALAFIAIRAYAVSLKKSSHKQAALAASTSGLYSGVNMGAVLGAMIMGKLGYEKVFFLSGILAVITILIVIFLTPKDNAKKVTGSIEHNKNMGSIVPFLVKNKEMMQFLLLITVPMAISVLFLDFFVPTYAIVANISTANVGRAYLINGICVAYIGPLFLKYLARFGNRVKLIIARIITFCAYIVFALFGNILAIIIAVSMMGVADGFGLVVESEYFLNLKGVKKIGSGQALAFMATLRKIGQSFAPQVFAIAMGLGSMKGIFGVALISIALTSLFTLISYNFNKKNGVIKNAENIG